MFVKMPKKIRYSKKPARQIDIAKGRIEFLLRIASKEFGKSKEDAKKHVLMARKVAMRYKMRFSSSQKKSFCKNCSSYLVPGVNLRVRLHKSRVIYYCLECKHFMRHPVK